MCKIEAGFKRVEKRRAKHARQLQEARQLEQAQLGDVGSVAPPSAIVTQSVSMAEEGAEHSTSVLDLPTVPTLRRVSPATSKSVLDQLSTYPTQQDRAEQEISAPNQRLGSTGASIDSATLSVVDSSRSLDGVELNALDVDALFEIFFKYYHPFLPFLDSSQGGDSYYRSSRLLFWAIISVASRRYSADLTLLPALVVSVPKLLWSTLQRVTHNYHDVKALCLLCVWPFPRSSSSSDPTFMLSGTLMSLAMQIGLHRPYQAQDFSQFAMRLPPDEIRDRITTWLTCKIVAQWVATGYGQSLAVIWDESSVSMAESSAPFKDIENQMKIEKLCATISGTLSIADEVPNVENDYPHSLPIDRLIQDLSCLELEFADQDCQHALFLYLHCARLHLRLQILHQLPTSPNYIESVLSLYDACNALVMFVHNSDMDVLNYCPNYVFQMILAAGFSVLRLSTSPLVEYIDALTAKRLFNSSIAALRKISITNNDLPGRLAEVLAQLKARRNRLSRELRANWNSLQLKVRSRLSMSITFDSLWEWRRGFVEDENGTVANKDAPSGTAGQFFGLSQTSPSIQDGEIISSLATNQNFDLNSMALDHFYPWMLENATEIPTFSSNLNEFTT